MKQIIVAIDGYSSCGKSTIAKQLAMRAGYKYVDTGAMYRAVALYLKQHNLLIADAPNVLENIHINFVVTPSGQHTYLNGNDVEAQIRTLEIGNLASQVSTIAQVRRFLVAEQQAMGHSKGIVMDGRDIGTVVFPEAELKLFLTAGVRVRAQRRFVELQQKGEKPVFEDVLKDVEERDYRDTHREQSPLRQADDAIVIDNSELTIKQQSELVWKIFTDKAGGTD